MGLAWKSSKVLHSGKLGLNRKSIAQWKIGEEVLKYCTVGSDCQSIRVLHSGKVSLDWTSIAQWQSGVGLKKY